MIFTGNEILEQEAKRLFNILGKVTDFKTGLKYNMASCFDIAPLTLQINRLKKERNAVILAHYYCTPDIVYGVADYRGDSYALSLQASKVKEDIILFSGVYFMAQTAKILNPQKAVYLPAVHAGCSLADSVEAADVAALKTKYPAAAFVCYINSTAEVKAICDICVTSANVYDIVASLPQKQIVFLPDIFMAENIKIELAKRGVEKEIIPFGGTCCVHDKYSVQDVTDIRAAHPDAKIICHPECASSVCAVCDYVGSTSGMLKYVAASQAKTFAVLSEDGIVNCMEYENPSNTFLPFSRTCAQMKRNNLCNILGVLQNPAAAPQVQVEESVRAKALDCVNNMFKTAGAK